jgi:hypothetical protein
MMIVLRGRHRLSPLRGPVSLSVFIHIIAVHVAEGMS